MTTDELQCFCAAQDNVRYYLRTPWTRDGYTWATNGHILVRVPALTDVSENRFAPSTLKLWNDVPEPKEWFPVPACAMPELVPCNWCDGTGKDPYDKSSICVDGARFARRFLALIQGWEISPTSKKGAAWIRYGEALGLLMPFRE